MEEFISILWQEYILFKRNFWHITISSLIAPTLYLIAFGWGLGDKLYIDGNSYKSFVVTGIIALTTMTSSYSTVGNSINISRLYERTFEEFMIAPISMFVYTIGKITAGALRGVYSGFLIIFLSYIFKVHIEINGFFLLVMILNCLVFSAIGFNAGIFIKSHADMAKFTSYIINPMAFLCGTFFPLERMPQSIRYFILLLPLTHTNLGLRNSGRNLSELIIHILSLLLYFIVMTVVGVIYCKKAE